MSSTSRYQMSVVVNTLSTMSSMVYTNDYDELGNAIAACRRHAVSGQGEERIVYLVDLQDNSRNIDWSATPVDINVNPVQISQEEQEQQETIDESPSLAYAVALILGVWTVQCWDETTDAVVWAMTCRDRQQADKVAQAYATGSELWVVYQQAYAPHSHRTYTCRGTCSRQRDTKRIIKSLGQHMAQWQVIVCTLAA